MSAPLFALAMVDDPTAPPCPTCGEHGCTDTHQDES